MSQIIESEAETTSYLLHEEKHYHVLLSAAQLALCLQLFSDMADADAIIVDYHDTDTEQTLSTETISKDLEGCLHAFRHAAGDSDS